MIGAIGLVARFGPAFAVVGVLLAAAAGGSWITSTVDERDQLELETAEQRETIAAYDAALKKAEADRRAVEAALGRAAEQTARLVSDRATILEDLSHATAPDCPVPDAVRRAVDRLYSGEGSGWAADRGPQADP
ncbi:hypothetical protein F1188_10970 [Roseospira marina]|uniref:Uncharacterized protein n=1 Tax=Roseospira marina TaxID=140057 RepID=A0A5M6IBT8_9PROT|nr:hypothetical protein [Roseospira marina]KAA5605417.1 hypothetical protein F1188_10970 [Roseospira marina]MBB4314590.1 hypothetical protein [Roseospira marina]MBB5088848.1 hypothetical protein [Roseospira marina]